VPVVKHLGETHFDDAQNGLFPSIEQLNIFLQGLEERPTSGCGVPLSCVEQKVSSRRTSVAQEGVQENYQLRLFLKGELLTRNQNWHDVFNFFTHCIWPKSKAVLNARHFFVIDETLPFPWTARPGQNRGPEQDLLTHVDEGGVLVVTSDAQVLHNLKNREWKEVFCRGRAALKESTRFWIFGHALFEDVLKGHPRPHGSGVGILVPPHFWEQDWDTQRQKVDLEFALLLQQRSSFKKLKDVFPVPLLGYPGFVPENEFEEFYEDKIYFRAFDLHLLGKK
jgi:hypothetical protein